MRISFGIIIFIISLTASNLIPFQTFSGTMPGAIYPFTVSLGDSIDGQITVSDPSIPISSFGYSPDFTGVDVSLIPGLQVSTNRYVATIPLGGQYYFGVSVANSAPLYTLVDYQFRMLVNGALKTSGKATITRGQGSAVHKLVINNACSFNYQYENKYSNAVVFTLLYPNKTVAFTQSVSVGGSIDKNQTVDSLKFGTWYIILETATIAALTPYAIVVKTFCENACLNSLNYVSSITCVERCGDGIMGPTELCDNGGRIGCLYGCTPDPNYNCYGSVGSTSFCLKQSICGDNILDSGEVCDNGNKIGCSSGCRPDLDYNCSAQLGKPSICAKCGNNLVEGSEECDNGNQVGCSKGCKIDAGFQCRSSPSYCFRKNPVCGNGVIEIAEECDDGNTNSLDGCSQWCTKQQGFKCDGQFGQKSSCSRQVFSPQCGNEVFQPFANSNGLIEQCDNGNQSGCINCNVEPNWYCFSVPFQKSFCYQITPPKCGNNIKQVGEDCDDGNIFNGDGCNSFCRREYAPPSNPTLTRQGRCGDGIIQAPFEQCDQEGFPVVGNDGCSINCKVQAGWICPPGKACFRI